MSSKSNFSGELEKLNIFSSQILAEKELATSLYARGDFKQAEDMFVKIIKMARTYFQEQVEQDESAAPVASQNSDDHDPYNERQDDNRKLKLEDMTNIYQII